MADRREAQIREEVRTEGVVTKASPALRDYASATFLPWIEATTSIEPATKKFYRNAWKLLSVTPLAKQRLSEIRNHHCETVQFPGGAYTANAALRTLRRMLGHARERGLLAKLPKVSLRKEWARSVSMTVEQAKMIAAQMPEGEALDAFVILRGTAMRPCECFSMRWENVNFEARRYQNAKGKTATSQRAIPLIGDELGVLQRRHAAAGYPTQGWVFASPRAKSGHLTTIAKTFSEARDAAKLPKSLVLYAARHGRLTDLGQVLSLGETMMIGGHSQSKTALRYQHPDAESIRERLEKVQTTGAIQ